MQPGEHYPSAIREALERSSVLLAIIGPDWLTLVDDDDVRLIDREHDWVRREIALAFSRGISVIPVLLEGAAQPLVTDLPGEISQLAHLQATRVVHKTFGADVQRLAARLAMLVPGLAAAFRAPTSTVPAPASLPADVADFTGRCEPIAQLRTLLDVAHHGHRGPVVIAGPPGVGKTALAVHIAHELAPWFEDGQLYGNFRGYDPRGTVPTAVALTWFLRALSA